MHFLFVLLPLNGEKLRAWFHVFSIQKSAAAEWQNIAAECRSASRRSRQFAC
jgi:hypothetical protein